MTVSQTCINNPFCLWYIYTGIPWVARKMMTASSPTIEISKKDDKWTVKTTTLMTSSSNTFSLGEEYEETMMGGRTIKVSVNI